MSQTLIDTIAKTLDAFEGESPYDWPRELRVNIQQARELALDISPQLPPLMLRGFQRAIDQADKDWTLPVPTEVCVFGVGLIIDASVPTGRVRIA